MRLSSAFWPSSGAAIFGAALGAAAAPAYDVLDFDWSTIAPSAKLKWHACYGDGEFQCARLRVPLDWTDPATDDDDDDVVAVAIAMIKLPATVPDDDPSFGGTIFTNPGGPGGSGVRHALTNAHTMRRIADRDDDDDNHEHDSSETNRRRGKRHYEILSWDPRGVLFTTPQADCFEGDLAARFGADLQRGAMGSLDSGLDVVRRQHARARGFGQLCERTTRNSSSILPFVSTASVARDMVEMVDRVHELRQEEAAAAAARPTNNEHDHELQRILELRGEKDEDVPRIQYWGFSYGSVLGNTFASMYPGRVGRMIVDGIADADDYMAGTWLTNLQDTEKIVEYFYTTCFSAPADLCPLKRPTDTSWADMKARVDALVDSLNAEPAVLLQNDDTDPEQRHTSTSIITGSLILSTFRRPVYSPAKEFIPLARALADAIDNANYTLVLEAQFQRSNRPPTLDDVFCRRPSPPPPPSPSPSSSPGAPGKGGESNNSNNNRSAEVATRSEADAARAILCGDGEDTTAHLGPDGLWEYVEELRRQSPTLGPYWSTIRFECAGWKIRPGWRFTGPFGTPPPPASLSYGTDANGENKKNEEKQKEKQYKGKGGGRRRPSAPLLFVTSRLDPVTPLRNAHAMAASHAGAAVLEVDAVGHCGSTVPSRCSREIIRDYLEFGRVDVDVDVVPPGNGNGNGNGSEGNNNSNNNNSNTIRCAAEFDPWTPPEQATAGMRSGPVDLQATWPLEF